MVKVFGVVDGSVIIGSVVSEYEKYYKLNNPVKVMVDVVQGKMGLVPICPFKVKGEYCLYKTGIVYEADGDENVEKIYNEYLLAIGEKKIFVPDVGEIKTNNVIVKDFRKKKF